MGRPKKKSRKLKRSFRLKLSPRTATALRRGVLGALAIAGVGLLAAGGAMWSWAFHDLPDTPASADALWDVRKEPSITLLAQDGTILSVRGPLYGETVRLTDLPSHVPQAFIAIEDRRFYEHAGVDPRGVLRAVLVNVRAGSTVQGGSTLTMQLVKNLILTPDRTIRRKLQEMRLARALERRLTKDEILELYLNRVYLGEQAYGIEAAAQRYFGKAATNLTLQEAAILASLPKAPSRLAPTENLAAARARARQVLDAMLEAGYIDPIAHIAALADPAELSEGFQSAEDPALFGHVFDFVAMETQRLLGADRTAPDLVIETTLDPALQSMAKQAIDARLAEESVEREAALVAMTPDGAIRAMIGGRNYAESQFNRAVQALRQPGSAFKPVVYAAALEAGYDSASAFEDAPIDLEGWTPENYGGGYRGRITMADALKRSLNTVAAQLVGEIGPDAVVDAARRFGFTTPMSDVPSIALGVEEVRLTELTAAYGAIASDGRRVESFVIQTIRNRRGEMLYERPSPPPSLAVAQDHARTLSTMLQSVLIDGTGQRADLDPRQAAGKTGTSQNNRDAWFVGFTAQLTAGVWVGHDDEAQMEAVTGGGAPALIWRDFMAMAHEGLPVEPLSAPAPRRRGEREERLAAFYSALSADFAAVAAPPAP